MTEREILGFFDCTGDKENPAELPVFGTEESACADIKANFWSNIFIFDNQNNSTNAEPLVTNDVKTFTLWPGDRACIPTGWRCLIAHGWQLKVVPRSGLALKSGITVVNSPGTIDSDYTDELKVILTNISNIPYTIKQGDRIAQLEISKNFMRDVKFVKFDDPKHLQSHKETSNRDGGFGHTGN